MYDEQFCCRCKEDFPVEELSEWQMGIMRPLYLAPKKIKEVFHNWLDHDFGSYLCGNCYFDLTDEDY